MISVLQGVRVGRARSDRVLYDGVDIGSIDHIQTTNFPDLCISRCSGLAVFGANPEWIFSTKKMLEPYDEPEFFGDFERN